MQHLARYFSTKVLLGDEASAEALYRLSPQAQILHLATHGVLDDNEPLASGLYLAKDSASGGVGHFLTAADIYALHLRSDITVLSACHTAAGRLSAGEGLLSLARAFSYAGSRSVVASRWLANDRSTARINNHFYAHLKSGATKAEALRLAKLAYLDEADALTAQPYYWAGLQLSGDEGPLLGKASRRWMFFVAMAVVVLGGLAVRRYT